MSTLTTNYDLIKPDDNEIGWAQMVRDNSDSIDSILFAKAPRGSIDITVSSGTYILTNEQFDNSSFDISGTLTDDVIIEIPDDIAQMFIVDNETSGAYIVSIKHNATAAIEIHQGTRQLLYTTGVVIEGVSATGGGETYTADQIIFVPAGDLEATDVQAALEELDTTLSSMGGGYTWIVKSSAYTASDNDGILADTSGGAFTITLPAFPTLNDKVMIIDGDVANSWATNNLTVARNGETIDGVAADFTADVDNGWVEFIYDGSTWHVRSVLASVQEDYILIRDEKPSGTSGGDFILGADRTRDLNTIVEDAGGHVTSPIVGNAPELAAGTYRFAIHAPARSVGAHQAQLYNNTDAEVIELGQSIEASTSGSVENNSLVVGRFTIEAAKALKVRHRGTSTKTISGFGFAGNFGINVYTIMELWKEVTP